jgi:hypothetical protein
MSEQMDAIVDEAWSGAVPVPGEDYNPGDYLAPPKILADGRSIWVIPTFFGARVCIAKAPVCMWFDDLWCYNGSTFRDDVSVDDWRRIAVLAALAWDGDGEPAGWTKHPATGRYRTKGDPLREYLEGSEEWARGGR